MNTAMLPCPQCLYITPPGEEARFCPRCGLAASVDATAEPETIQIPGETVVVRDPVAFGEICNLYRCTLRHAGRQGVFKIARTHLANAHVEREHKTLTRLHKDDVEGRFAPFLPFPVATLNYAHADGGPARVACVLAYHAEVGGPDRLYTLEEVRSAYPDGIDARDMAWIWRRVLTVLGFVHAQRIAHTALTPSHILIEPKEHKLVLIGWCGAVAFGRAPILIPQRWRDWGRWEGGASSANDIASAARSMSYLLGSPVEPAIARHLERAAEPSASSSGATKFLEDFDRLIEALWGPRQFRTFAMPERAAQRRK